MGNGPVIAQSLQELDPFDHAFVETVLRLEGVDEMPTAAQLRAAVAVLNAYYTAMMRAPVSKDPVDEEWLDGHTLDSAAAEFAFLFTQYGVLYVSEASEVQVAAFTSWWQTGELPTRPSLHVRSSVAAGH